jgi:hypothetical protein
MWQPDGWNFNDAATRPVDWVVGALEPGTR